MIVVTVALAINKPASVKFVKLESFEELSETDIKKKICEEFKLKNFEILDIFMEKFVRLPEQLLQKSQSKMLSGDIKDFADIFCEKNLDSNLKNFSVVYQHYIPEDGIDERCFIRGESIEITPTKFTPFSRQKVGTTIITPKRPKPTSAINLGKESEHAVLKQISFSSKLDELNISSRTPIPTIKSQATPMSRAMEMNNWLYDQVNKTKFNENDLTTEYLSHIFKSSQMFPKIKHLTNNCIEKISKSLECPKELKLGGKTYQIKCIHYYLMEEILKIEEKTSKSGVTTLIQTEDFHKGMFLAAT